MECLETVDGPTIWEDHFFPEIVNPDDGTPLADGEHGELLFTTLTKEALPVIRYRTRDLTRLLPGTARTMRRMDRISGRSDDMLIIRGVNVFPSQLEEEILSLNTGAALPAGGESPRPSRFAGSARGAERERAGAESRAALPDLSPAAPPH